MKQIMLASFIILSFAACSFAPRFTRPEAPIPEEWPKGAAYEKIGKTSRGPDAIQLKWRDFITDPKLRRVIEIALENNRDLKLAALRVEEARAIYGVRRAELFPALGGSAMATEQRTSADLTRPGEPRTTEQYSVTLGITAWEIDFFGRIRGLEKKALEEYLATEEAWRSARISLISEVTRAYLTLAADQDELQLARSTLETQQEIYNMVRRQYRVGLANELDLRRAETQVESARREVSRYVQLVAQDKNALNLLVGSSVSEGLLPSGLAHVSPPRDISPGLSSRVLLNRPDIMAAEHRLKAAYAYIGAARAAFFPNISLTTLLGRASDDLLSLFDSGTGTWSFTPQLTMPLFDTRVWAAYRVSKAQRKIALVQYEKAIQTAFREVADTLAVKGTIDGQLKAQKTLVNALKRTYELAKQRYVDGIDSYFNVLDAQRTLYAAQKQLVSLQLTRVANDVRLYAVLGGGVQ